MLTGLNLSSQSLIFPAQDTSYRRPLPLWEGLKRGGNSTSFHTTAPTAPPFPTVPAASFPAPAPLPLRLIVTPTSRLHAGR